MNGSAGAERDQVARARRQRLLEPVDDGAEGVRDREADDERDEAEDEPRAQLAEVLDERASSPWLETPRQEPHAGALEAVSRSAGAGRACSSPALGAAPQLGPRRSSSSSLPVTESLNSRIPLPSDRPISGRRFGPKTRSTTISEDEQLRDRSSRA